MKRKILFSIFLIIAGSLFSTAQESDNPPRETPIPAETGTVDYPFPWCATTLDDVFEDLGEKPVPAETVFDYPCAVTLGIVEGMTEYLPVSSTGHLIITNTLLGLDSEAPLLARGNDKQIVTDKNGEAVSVKTAADAYSIIIQFGAILAVLFAYWGRCTGTLVGICKNDPASWRLTRNLIIAFVPAAGLGFFFHDYIEAFLFNPGSVAVALVFGAIIMLAVDRSQKNKVAAYQKAHVGALPPDTTDLQDLSIRQSLTIGIMQCLALWPGMSRSMATIVGGYIAGLSPRRATEFSFLLGLITLTAASLYKTLKSYDEMLQSFGAGVSLLGLAIAFVVAFVSVKWLVEWISRHGLAAFAYYRILLAIATIFVWCFYV
ncbi:MAG: undecaprenyl-diphosphate phosphatase [Opitutales bacterium]|nr:undecaprenyl-diphosphate phosphatase [Opitutales bacterium]